MSLRTVRQAFSNCLLAISFLLATAVPVTHAQVVVEENAPLAGEIATQQIGGAGFSSYSFHGALRCNSYDAMIGVKIRKGTLVDYMKIECAPLERGANGSIVWQPSKIYSGGWAGNINGGNMGRFTRCPVGYVISGFKAIYSGNNDYLSDIRFMCSQIAGAAMYPSPLGMTQYYQIKTTQRRQFISWFGDDVAIRSYSLGYNRYAIAKQLPDMIDLSPRTQLKPESECTGGGAAALSVAVGSYISFFQFHPVVQAFQMFCYGGSLDIQKAKPYLSPFENGQ